MAIVKIVKNVDGIPPGRILLTHDGVFHAHEVFACALMSPWYDYIIRTRDENIIGAVASNPRNFVVDIGEKAEGNILDHHQYQGYKGIEAMFGIRAITLNNDVKRILESVGKLDCGVDDLNIVTRNVSGFNPTWDLVLDEVDREECFKKAIDYAVSVIEDPLPWIAVAENMANAEESKEHALIYVNALILKAEDDYIILESGMPWLESVLTMNDRGHNINFVVFPDISYGWRIRIAPLRYGSFDLRVSYDFSKSDGCYFQHPNGFISGFHTREQAERAVKEACVELRNNTYAKIMG